MAEVVKKYSDFDIKVEGNKKFVGEKMKLHKVLNKEIMIHFYSIEPSKYPEKGSDTCLWLQISVDGKKYISFSIAKLLMVLIEKVPKDGFPFTTTITNENDSYEFT